MELNKLFSKLLLGGVLIPLGPSHWTKTNFPFKFAPDYSFKNSQITIESDDDLGGYAHKLSESIPINEKSKIVVKWQVDKYPKVTPQLPFDKKNDDYPVRIGLIISGGPKAEIPKSVLKRLPFKKEISNIIYYGPIKQHKLSNYFCGESPHNSYAVYCAVPGTKRDKEFTAFPYRDLKSVKKSKYKAEILGVWLFADTDDSESESKVTLKSIKIQK